MQRVRALIIVLFIYVLLQFSWWAYMLIGLNNELNRYKIELVSISNQPEHEKTVTIQKLSHKLETRWMMVAGEGFVFISLLIFGIYKIMQAYNREYQLSRSQKNFLLSITHEFKSPLAAIKLNLQTMQKHLLSQEQKEAILNSSITETNRLNRLVEDTLTAAQIETHTFTISSELINLSDCVYDALQSRIHLSQHKIELDLDEDLFINGDCQAISSIVLNLVDNAAKYSPVGTLIKVHTYVSGKEIHLQVSDNGIGIPENEKENIFQKFYRIGNEEVRKTKGTGLGLFIVDRLVRMHHARIEVLPNKPCGTIFKIHFSKPAIED